MRLTTKIIVIIIIIMIATGICFFQLLRPYSYWLWVYRKLDQSFVRSVVLTWVNGCLVWWCVQRQINIDSYRNSLIHFLDPPFDGAGVLDIVRIPGRPSMERKTTCCLEKRHWGAAAFVLKDESSSVAAVSPGGIRTRFEFRQHFRTNTRFLLRLVYISCV